MVDGLQGQSFGPVSFTLEPGEIVGIAGAEGNGQPQLFDCLAGRQPPKAGRVVCDGKELSLISTHEAVAAGVMLLPGDRKHEALMPVLGVKVNATIQSLRHFSVLGFLSRRRERRAVADLVERLEIRTPSLEQPVEFLSGGNQQKVSVARSFLKQPSVILAYEPTQGVDVGSRFDIYKALRTRTNKGTAMLVKSSDPIELAGLCDRVLVMSRGQIIEEIPGDELDELRIVEAMVRGPGLSKAGRSPLGVAMPKAPPRTGGHERARRRCATRRSEGHPRRSRQEQVAEDRQVPPVDAGGTADPAGRSVAVVHQRAVPGLRQRHQRRTDPHPGAPPDRRRDGADACAPRRVPRSLRRWHDRSRGRHRLVPDRRRGFGPPDPDRGRRHPPVRRRPRPRQRRPDPRTQDPLDHRHPGHVEHPGRDLADHATDGPGRHQPRPGVGAHDEHRTDPRGLHRRRRRGGSGRVCGSMPPGPVSS